MKRLMLCALGATMIGIAGCGGDEPRCAQCDVDYGDAQCMAFATAHGCESGESYLAAEFCDGTRRGCRFFGCPTDRSVMCEVPPADAGM